MLGIDLQETRVYQEVKAEGERSLILRLLTRKLGDISPEQRSHIEKLSLLQLEALGDGLLDFATLEQLAGWLQSHPAESQSEN